MVPLRGKEGDWSVNCSSPGRGKMALTASARVQLTVWTKLDAMDRAVMALQNLTLLAIDRVHADPFICQAASNETIL